MKTAMQLKKEFPQLRFRRFDDLVSTTVNGLRVGLAWHNGIDTINLMRPRSAQKPTQEEIDAVCDMFFSPDEREHVRVIPHPRYVNSILIYRVQEGSYGKLDQV